MSKENEEEAERGPVVITVYLYLQMKAQISLLLLQLGMSLMVAMENKNEGYQSENESLTLEEMEQIKEAAMSKLIKVHLGQKIEPVIFEQQEKIKLSQSPYKVTSYIDFTPYKETFQRFGSYMNNFLKDLADPDHVGHLTRKGGTEKTQKLEEIFGDQCTILFPIIVP